ncbi:MAG: hypothetical protein ACOX8S_04310 [Christensenellales bacterium]|jgi:hypothetical protein
MSLENWEDIRQADFSSLTPEDFFETNLCSDRVIGVNRPMSYFVHNFHRLANSITKSGPQRGCVEAIVWRAPIFNQPFNARIMESHLSLAYFYCTDAKWNPYYAMPAVRVRLEAMLEYLLTLQLPDGMFPEYGVGVANLAASAFFTKFMGETLRLLKNGPPIDQDLYRRVLEADRRAIHVVLTDPGLWVHSRSYSNQYTNVWPGALAYLNICEDKEIEELLADSLANKHLGELQSEAGFYYEANQPDWGYTLHTHNTNERYAWFYAKDTPYEAHLAEGSARYYDYLSYNCVREPDGFAFFFNRGIESRQKLPFVGFIDTELGEAVPLARAFMRDRDEVERTAEEMRARLKAQWPPCEDVDSVDEVYSFSPYAFLLEGTKPWHPTKEQKQEQISLLPYLRGKRFIHQRMDRRTQLVNLYVRREAYYCAFNSGASFTPQQRFGLGLLWNDQAGMWIQSQSGCNEAFWGCTKDGQVVEKSLGVQDTIYRLDGRRTAPVIGMSDWQGDALEVEYYWEKATKKTVAFVDEGLRIDNRMGGELCEHIPLLLTENDLLSWTQGRLCLSRGERSLVINYDPSCKVSLKPMGTALMRYNLYVLKIAGKDAVSYTITTK